MTLPSLRRRNIRIVFTDVDGVLTDGGMYYGPNGEIMKRFDTRDGMGVSRLRQAGIDVVIVTQEDSEIVRARASKLKIDRCFVGVTDKAAKVKEVCVELGTTPEHAAYIGDDVNDLEALRIVGLSAAPADAVDEVRRAVTVICHNRGGHGAFREVAELLLQGDNA